MFFLASDDKRWLTYWLVFGTFSILDHLVECVLAYVPFYFLFKLAFLLYLFMPFTDGANMIYEKYLSPFYKKYEGQIDGFATKYQEIAKLAETKKSE
jgi:receptor expression-enhancing protein 5/6